MKQIEAKILNQAYTLVCPPEGEERLRAAVQRVDATMTRIRNAGKVLARDRIAVLAAVNLAFEDGPHQAAAATAPGGDAHDAQADAAKLHQLMARLDETLSRDDRLF